MANICENRLFLSTENKEIYKKMLSSIDNDMSCCDVNEMDDNRCEINFESRWVFPQEYFEELIKDIEDETLYIRVLSYEFGCDYVGYHVYQGGEWTDKLAEL